MNFLGKVKRKVFNAILDFEKRLLEEPIPDHWERVDWTDILDMLLEVYPFAKIYLSDRYYYLPSLEDIFDFLDGDETDKEHYVSEFHDCDDFSFRLMGQFHIKPWSAIAIAIVWSGVHAYNLVVVTQEGVFLIEPQTDEVFRPDGGATYASELIII